MSFQVVNLRIIFFTLFLFTISKGFSQENYQSGYVINQKADSLFGYIDYRNWEKNPDKIDFKTNLESKSVTFYAIELKEFKVMDEVYKSGIVDIEVSSNRTETLGKSPQMNIVSDTTFLQTLVDGDKSLYYYRHTNGKEYFYIGNDSGYDLLQYKRYMKYGVGNPQITENNKFIGQLIIYLKDCESVKSKINQASYKKNSLIKIFQEYYSCIQPGGITFQKNKDKGKGEFGLFLGPSFTSIEFRSSIGFEYLTQGNFDNSLDPSFGLFYNFILPRNQGKLSILSELQYNSYKSNGYYEETVNEHEFSSYETSVGNSYLKLNLLLRYKYPLGSGFVFVNGGFSNGIVVSQTNYNKESSTFYSQEKIRENMIFDDPRKFEQTYILGAGYLKNRFSLETRYEKGNGMNKSFGIGHLTTRFYLLVGIKLNK